MIFDEEGIKEIPEIELFLTWANDDLIQSVMPYQEYMERMQNTGVAVFEYIDGRIE